MITPARAVAAATAARIDTRRGSLEAAEYMASPIMMPNGKGALPQVMTTAVAAVATASPGSGQRLSSTIGPPQTMSPRTRCCPGAQGATRRSGPA